MKVDGKGSEELQDADGWAVAKLGKKRFYWVVFPPGNIHETYASDGRRSGCAPTREAAVTMAEHLATDDAKRWPDGMARESHRIDIAKRKAQRRSATNASAPMEFVWGFYNGGGDGYEGEPGFVPHRLVKRTKRKIFVERDFYQESKVYDEGWQEYAWRETFTLDRQKFERLGYARPGRHSTALYDCYYRTPDMNMVGGNRQAGWCDVLGIEMPCSLSAVKRAYRRKVLETHPDHGGTSQDFMAVQSAYEDALRVVT